MNTYGYVGGNSLRYSDPLGLLYDPGGTFTRTATTQVTTKAGLAGLGPIGLGIGVGLTVAEALLPGYTSVVDIPDLPAANDDQMCKNTSSEDDDDCKQLLKDMILLFKYVASQVNQNGRANSLMLINSYNKQAASACKICPGICAAIPRFD